MHHKPGHPRHTSVGPNSDSSSTLSQSPPNRATPAIVKRRKIQVACACSNCKQAHLGCDNERPCRRCVSLGKGDTCVDVVPKKRGRPPSRRPHSSTSSLSSTTSPSKSKVHIHSLLTFSPPRSDSHRPLTHVLSFPGANSSQVQYVAPNSSDSSGTISSDCQPAKDRLSMGAHHSPPVGSPRYYQQQLPLSKLPESSFTPSVHTNELDSFIIHSPRGIDADKQVPPKPPPIMPLLPVLPQHSTDIKTKSSLTNGSKHSSHHHHHHHQDHQHPKATQPKSTPTPDVKLKASPAIESTDFKHPPNEHGAFLLRLETFVIQSVLSPDKATPKHAIWGYSPHDLLHISFYHLVHDLDRHSVRKIQQEFLEHANASISIELRQRHRKRFCSVHLRDREGNYGLFHMECEWWLGESNFVHVRVAQFIHPALNNAVTPQNTKEHASMPVSPLKASTLGVGGGGQGGGDHWNGYVQVEWRYKNV